MAYPITITVEDTESLTAQLYPGAELYPSDTLYPTNGLNITIAEELEYSIIITTTGGS